jgi:hypothetical protein
VDFAQPCQKNSPAAAAPRLWPLQGIVQEVRYGMFGYPSVGADLHVYSMICFVGIAGPGSFASSLSGQNA